MTDAGPALVVRPKPVRLVNPKLNELAEAALFDEPAPTGRPLRRTESGSSGISNASDQPSTEDLPSLAPRPVHGCEPFSL